MAHFGLQGEAASLLSSSGSTVNLTHDEALETAIGMLPYRSLTDALVQSYLQTGNMQYYSIHSPSFLRDYDTWWTAREKHQPLSASFTCLLLQVCSSASQSPDAPLSQRLRYDLTEPNAQTSSRLFAAADKLGRSIPPGRGGLHRVMQLLLAAAWLKTEGQILEAWHILSTAVREAQECAPSDSDTSRSPNDMNVENWRRVWSFIVFWDWQLAERLARPLLTEASDMRPLPDPSIDDCGKGQPSPSPIGNLCEQTRLVRTLRSGFGRLSEMKDANQIHEAAKIIEHWRESLPGFLRMEDGDQSWDEACPWLPAQRTSLHCFAKMARLTPLKQLMTKTAGKSEVDGNNFELLQLAAGTTIDCVDAAVRRCRTMSPAKKAFYFVVFALFDAATVICSALLQDHDKDLERWPQLLTKAEVALMELGKLSESTVSAKWSAQILRWLLKRVREAQVRPLRDEAIRTGQVPVSAMNGAGSTVLPMPEQMQETGEDVVIPVQTANSHQDSAQEGATWPPTLDRRDIDSNNPSLVLSPGLMNLQQLPDLDMGGLESIWDWEALGIAFGPEEKDSVFE